MNRREFIYRAIVAGTAMTDLNPAGVEAGSLKWQIGCFNRPWTKWPFDQALKEIKAAGYKTAGLLTRTKEEPFIGAEASPAYLEGLKRRIAASGLLVNMGALRSRHDVPLEDSIREVRKQIDNAHFLSLKYVMSFGADKQEEYSHYFRVMSNIAAYAQEKSVRLVMKPHGGISGSSNDILRVIKEVNHPNFSIWYDAGNIIHYTGKDPVAELYPVAKHITGFCAKDCGEVKGEVMIQFGAGKVDFVAIFEKLKAAGFKGPVMVECCKVGETPEETTANARANREYLEKVFRSL
jgi:sugar phosphate isomerase/epimerase